MDSTSQVVNRFNMIQIILTIGLLNLALWPVYLLLKYLNISKRIFSITTKIKHFFIFKIYLIFLMEAYFFNNLYGLNELWIGVSKQIFNPISFLVTIAFCIFILSIPISMCILYRKYKSDINTLQKGKLSQFYDGILFSKSKFHGYYQTIHLIRKLFLALSCVLLHKQNFYLKFSIFTSVNLIGLLAIIIFQPYENKMLNLIEFINEA